MQAFHPKTSGAAVGSAAGVVIVGVLNSVHGVHLDPTLNGSIPAFLGILGSFLAPDSLPPPPGQSLTSVPPGGK